MRARIPKLFHFIFGLKEQSEAFHLAYYLCLRSCLDVNDVETLYFYYHYEPYGKYWELIKPSLTLVKVPLETFVTENQAYDQHQEGHFIKAHKLDYAHQADFIRLKKLIELGGVYADIDTLFVNPIPDELYQHPFVIGREQDVVNPKTNELTPSLCNALLMAEPNSEFARRWLQSSYSSFDGTWNSHSCRLAAQLADEIPEQVYITPSSFFYKHMWTKEGIYTLFEGLDTDFSDVLSMHMWNHLWWDESRDEFSKFHSGLLTESIIMANDTTYNVVARRFLPSFESTMRERQHDIDSLPESAVNSSDKVTVKNRTTAILVPEIIAGWALSKVDDNHQFIHLESNRSYTTNESTDLILEYCDGFRNVDAVIQAVAGRVRESVETVSNDVQTTLRELALAGAIRFKQLRQTAPVGPVRLADPIPEKHYKLCIGMATYDDYDGVYFSVQAIRLYHPEILGDVEILVLDNNPGGVCADALKSLADWIPNYRYIAGDNFQGTWSRFSLMNQTNADYIMCMDSHVMILPGAIKRLLDYFETNPDTPDFLQGPLLGDDLNSLSSHFTPGWGAGMYGTWDIDPRANDIDNDPFDIPMQGLGLFAMRKESWPTVNPRFKGFGGEEGYIHEKVRRAGGRTLCLPFLRWVHRFNRPMGAKYALNWDDRIRNYMIAHDELGIDNQEMIAHFNQQIGVEKTTAIVAKVEAELNNPFSQFDAIFCINMDVEQARWAAATEQFERLGFGHRVQRFAAVETPESHHIGCTLSHRAIIQIAASNQYKNVLVLEDDVVFDTATLFHLTNCLRQIQAQSWDMLYLGAHCWGKLYPFASGGECVREVDATDVGPTCTHAIVYNQSSYAQILGDLPSEVEEMTRFVKHENGSIDQYLAASNAFRRLIVEPRVASQPPLLIQEVESFTPLLTEST